MDSGTIIEYVCRLFGYVWHESFCRNGISKRHPSINEQRHELDFVGSRDDKSTYHLSCRIRCEHLRRKRTICGYGVFLSTDNGASWTAADSGLTNTSVSSLAVSTTGTGATNIFAGTQNGGVFRSTNSGKSWTLPSARLSNEIVYALGVKDTNLFAATGEGVFLSTDNGTSWTAAGLSNAIVSALAIWGTNIFAGTVYTGVSNGGIFLSTDNGTSWTAVDTGLTNTNISSLAISETDLFAGTNGNGYVEAAVVGHDYCCQG